MPTLIRWREETLKRLMQSYRCAKILSQSFTTEYQIHALILTIAVAMLFKLMNYTKGMVEQPPAAVW